MPILETMRWVRFIGKIFLFASRALVFAGLVAWAQPAEARRGGSSEFRFRFSGGIGAVDYTATSFATNAMTQYNALQYGFRLQAEAWLDSSFGFLVDSELWQAGLFGRPVYFNMNTLSLALRVMGDGGANNTEWVISAGGSAFYWPDARAYVRTSSVNLVYAKEYGVTVGMRGRAYVNPKWAVEVGGGYTAPLRMFGPANAKVDRVQTSTLTGGVLLDYRVYEGMGLGLAYVYEQNKLSYVPTENPSNQPQTVEINISGPLLSLRFWF